MRTEGKKGVIVDRVQSTTAVAVNGQEVERALRVAQTITFVVDNYTGRPVGFYVSWPASPTVE
jgi:hypothetical protein